MEGVATSLYLRLTLVSVGEKGDVSNSHPRFEKLPVTLSGALRDDCSGAHSFVFLRRKGPMTKVMC